MDCGAVCKQFSGRYETIQREIRNNSARDMKYKEWTAGLCGYRELLETFFKVGPQLHLEFRLLRMDSGHELAHLQGRH